MLKKKQQKNTKAAERSQEYSSSLNDLHTAHRFFSDLS